MQKRRRKSAQNSGKVHREISIDQRRTKLLVSEKRRLIVSSILQRIEQSTLDPRELQNSSKN